MIIHPTILEGNLVKLMPFESSHYAALEAVAVKKAIWEFYSVDGSAQDAFAPIFEAAFAERERGSQYPFAIFHKESGKIIGSTRFTEIQVQHKRLEIGWTWLDPAYWATAVNLECKLLLLTHCFEVLGLYRVQLRTDVLNIRSRKAIEKIGATFEGVFRHDMVRGNGSKRDSVYYSIIDTEWPTVKDALTLLLEAKQKSNS